MICDQIGNADRYRGLGPLFARGFDTLAALKPEAFAPGRIEIEGDVLYASAAEYQSRRREEGKWESHRLYADIQFLVEGEERIAYAPISSLRPSGPYDEGKDRLLYYDEPGSGQLLHYRAGWFAVFFPEDGHMPSLAADLPARVRKVVVKVRL